MSFGLEAELFMASLEEDRYDEELPTIVNTPYYWGCLFVAFSCLLVMWHICTMLAAASADSLDNSVHVTNLSSTSIESNSNVLRVAIHAATTGL